MFKVALFLALAGYASAQTCCQTCDEKGDGTGLPVCDNWGLNNDYKSLGDPVSGTKEECAALEFFSWMDADGNCENTGYRKYSTTSTSATTALLWMYRFLIRIPSSSSSFNSRYEW